MNIAVVGLWHLGTVTAACLARAGYRVTGLDSDASTVARLNKGQPPLFEPGLAELIEAGQQAGRLTFTTDPAAALAEAELVWVTFDTPVDDDDKADVAFVIQAVQALFPHLPDGVLVLISSQLPVGSTGQLETLYEAAYPDKVASGTAAAFAYSPENLRLGKAISVFENPERVVIGLRREADKPRLAHLFQPFTERLVWMSVESAEMTKHAINAFLATSVTFINELAALCEQVGADAREVEQGLKSESRIGPRAYLGPGSAFAGGTLARDIAFLIEAGQAHELPMQLFSAVRASNESHKLWAQRKLQALLGSLKQKQVAVLGLTYKPGTDTLRRSAAVELCRWIQAQGGVVQAYDPAIQQLPAGLRGFIALHPSAQAALSGAEAMVVATEWPAFKEIGRDEALKLMRRPIVIDANRFLAAAFENDQNIFYATVGKST